MVTSFALVGLFGWVLWVAVDKAIDAVCGVSKQEIKVNG